MKSKITDSLNNIPNKERNLTGRGTNDVGGEGDSIILLLGGGDFLLGGGDSSSWGKGDSGGSERGDWVGDSMIFSFSSV